MATILLDRNLTSEIKHYNGGKGDDAAVKIARDCDQRAHLISPLLSVIEGCLKKPQSSAAMYDCLIEETSELDRFFKHARTDSLYLLSNNLELVQTFATQSQEEFKRYGPLVQVLQEKLQHTVSPKVARRIGQEILDLALDHQIGPGHPIVICALACLHNNKWARKVLKPTTSPPKGNADGHAYNALHDLLKLTQLANLRSMFKRSKSGKLIFKTADAGFLEFLTQFRTEVKRRSVDPITQSETIEYICTLTRPMFPELDHAGFAALEEDMRRAQAKAKVFQQILFPQL